MTSLALPQINLQNWLRPERSGQVARVINILLILWLAWILASLSWLVLPESDSETVDTGLPDIPVPVQREETRIDEREIASWHVFGVAGEEQATRPVVADAPETRLKLTLRGLFSTGGDDGRAIIGDPRGKEETYSVNDPVPGGARLAEIYSDRVILERNGRYETLRLPKDRADLGAQQPAVAPRSSSGSGQAAAFSRYRDEIKRNPGAFLKYVRATPARENGQFIGFRLAPGPDAAALEQLGLQSGDIVTSINEVRIDSPAKGMRAMRSLGEGENVSVTLLRDGVETSLSLSVPTSEN